MAKAVFCSGYAVKKDNVIIVVESVLSRVGWMLLKETEETPLVTAGYAGSVDIKVEVEWYKQTSHDRKTKKMTPLSKDELPHYRGNLYAFISSSAPPGSWIKIQT